MHLFPESLISAELQKTLPRGFVIRPLCSLDYDKGFLTALSHLTTVGHLSKDEFLQRFHEMKAATNTYFTIVIEDTILKRIAAAGSIVIEKKFVHKNGTAGHIEDIVVLSDYRGKNFGKWIIEQLKHIGERVGVYKIILDCSDKNVPFYEKCGFKQKEVEMVLYYDANDASKSDVIKAKL